MANYIGVHCPVCEKKFTEEDDIVVCPICGAPHHRACYQKLGHCALEEMHIKGHTWENPQKQEAASSNAGDGALACSSCGAQNPPTGLFCQTCGAPLRRQTGAGPNPNAGPNQAAQSGFAPNLTNAYTMAFGGLSPEEEIDGVSVRDLALFVGSNSYYFLPRFKMLMQHNGFAVNFAALFFNFFYFFYRKMYLVGSIMLAAVLLCYVPAFLLIPEWVAFCIEHLKDIMMGIDVFSLFHPQNHLWAVQLSRYLFYIPFFISFAGSIFANRLYMKISVAKVKKIKAENPGANYSPLLGIKGHTNIIAVILVAVALIVGYFAVAYLFMMPYMDEINQVLFELYTAP